MAEFSMWWTTGGAGDGSATYTRSDHTMWSKVLASCNGLEGVAPNYLNKLVGAAGGANTVNIGTGGALVDGKIYHNSAAVAVNIPSAVGGGNTRIDRIVLRADWTAQTVRITRIAGTDAASPVAPAITQSPGATYDIQLCRVLVDTAGAVTVTDERTLAQVQTADLASLAVASGNIAANAVDNTKIRDSAALSVIGRGANSAGDPADIAAGTDGHVLRRAGTALAFGQVATGGITDLAVTEAKIGALAVTLAKLAADSVDDTKAGNRVPQFYRRQGNAGATSEWIYSVGGSTNFTPTAVRMMAGHTRVQILSGQNNGNVVVTFPVAFSAAPFVFLTSKNSTYYDLIFTYNPTFGGASMTVHCHKITAPGIDQYFDFLWLAIGPE